MALNDNQWRVQLSHVLPPSLSARDYQDIVDTVSDIRVNAWNDGYFEASAECAAKSKEKAVTMRYCRRRGRNKDCSIKTYNKNAVCAKCQEELGELADDLAYIKELGIVANPARMADDTDL